MEIGLSTCPPSTNGLPARYQYRLKTANEIRHLDFGLYFDEAYEQSHQGLSITSGWYLNQSPTEARNSQDADDQMRTATLTTQEDQANMLGKPGRAPTIVEKLTHAVHVHLLCLDTIIGLNGNHQKWVRLIGDILNDKYVELSLTASQIIDIFWTIFRDARFFFDHTETGAYSQLARLVADLERRYIG